MTDYMKMTPFMKFYPKPGRINRRSQSMMWSCDIQKDHHEHTGGTQGPLDWVDSRRLEPSKAQELKSDFLALAKKELAFDQSPDDLYGGVSATIGPETPDGHRTYTTNRVVPSNPEHFELERVVLDGRKKPIEIQAFENDSEEFGVSVISNSSSHTYIDYFRFPHDGGEATKTSFVTPRSNSDDRGLLQKAKDWLLG